jgi:hypothetical protein
MVKVNIFIKMDAYTLVILWTIKSMAREKSKSLITATMRVSFLISFRHFFHE